MIGASKILTVSYGTFSCTLEGFEEPFGTMKAIAEYFRDLAAEDRYFGAEPPTPDTAMLHRIAEREIHRRVEARVQDNGVILRAESIGDRQDALSGPGASLRPVKARDAADAEPVDNVAAKLMRIRAAAVASGAVTASMPDTAADAGTTISAGMLPADGHFHVGTDHNYGDDIDDGGAAIGVTADATASDEADETVGLADLPMADAAIRDVETSVDHTVTEDTTDPEIDVTVSATSMLDDATPDELPEDELSPTDQPKIGSSDDGLMQGLEDAPASAGTSDEPESNDDIRHPSIAAADDAFGSEDWDFDDLDETDALPAIPTAVAGLGDTSAIDAPVMARFDEASVEPATMSTLDDLDADDDDTFDTEPEAVVASAEPRGVTVPDPVLVAPAPIRHSAAMEKVQRARARVIRIRRADAPDFEARPSGLTPEAAAELARALANDRPVPDLPVPELVPPTRPIRRASMIEDEEPVVEASVSRLLAQTATEMEVPEQRRRRSAIEHLKAAVAATVADRRVGGARPPSEEERADPYRTDLSQMVNARPVMPVERSTPLVLVSEQRIDRAPVHDDAASRGIRPRRVGGSILALHSVVQDDEPDEADEDPDAGEPIDPQGFAAFADRLGAEKLADLLEAAAAYTAVIEGRPHFSRPHLMRQVSAIVDDEDFTRETGLRSFGTLLRTGRVVRVKRGQYALSETSRFMAEARAL